VIYLKAASIFLSLAVAWLAVWWIWDRGMVVVYVVAMEAIR